MNQTLQHIREWRDGDPGKFRRAIAPRCVSRRAYVSHAQGNPAAQIPKKARGVLGTMSPELAQQVRVFLVGKLRR